MTIETAGMTVTIAALIAALACLTWAALRLNVVARRVGRVTGHASVLQIGRIGTTAEKVVRQLDGFNGVGLRLAQLRDDLAETVSASSVLAADVRAVAAATETLLEATIPSMRGHAADSL